MNSFLPSAHEIHHKAPASHLGHQKNFRTAMGSGIAIASRRIFNILPIRYTSGPQHVRTQEQIMLLSSHLGTAPCSGCHGRFFPPSSAPVHTTSGIGECLVKFAQNASCELVLAISPRNPPQGTSQPSGAPERFSYCNGLWYSNRFQAHLQHIANSIYQWPTTCKNSRAKSCFCQATSAPHLVADATGVFFLRLLLPFIPRVESESVL